MISLICAVIFTSNFLQYQATVTIDFDEDLRECGNGLPMPDMDMSQFSILPQDDGSLLLNGTVTINKSYNDPTRWKMYTERLEQGKWNPGIVSRDIPNLCPVLKMPSEPWYQYTKHLENVNCPIKAGYVERLDNLNIGNMAAVFDVPPQFIGEWKVYHEISTIRNGFPARECFMIPTTISEV
ncbi:uncharacterized protein LOC120416764 [Culex pipiens pallens]|uniref:uncharacterized protein LOC120416764 n=1 Tax=Culex pipiens pallens TaxID=42434 RepID=UPI0019532746|nr:uncharacterized protein LOC120416764 [Culex pipiens pallens]